MGYGLNKSKNKGADQRKKKGANISERVLVEGSQSPCSPVSVVSRSSQRNGLVATTVCVSTPVRDKLKF